MKIVANKRHHIALSSVALVGLAGAFAGCGAVGATNVPWVNRPGQTWAQVAASTTPSCAVGDLSLPTDQQKWGGAWHGETSGYFVIANSGTSTCLVGVPTAISAHAADGTSTAFTTDTTLAPVVLAPGDTLQVQVLAPPPDSCGKPPANSNSFVFTFPNGTGDLDVPNAQMAVECGGSLADFSGIDAGPAVQATPYSALEASIADNPATLKPGADATFAVTLSNPTTHSIGFKECPSYAESIKGVAGSQKVYQLNCQQARDIAPGSSEKFQMKLHVPENALRGPAAIGWHLLVPTDPDNDKQFASVLTPVK